VWDILQELKISVRLARPIPETSINRITLDCVGQINPEAPYRAAYVPPAWPRPEPWALYPCRLPAQAAPPLQSYRFTHRKNIWS